MINEKEEIKQEDNLPGELLRVYSDMVFKEGESSQNSPIFITVAGQSGSGKTTYANKMFKGKNLCIFDVDELNEMLYGWLKSQGKEFVSGTFPTNPVFFGFLKKGIEERRNIVLQGTASSVKFLGNIHNAKEHGYSTVSLVIATSPERSALQSIERYIKEFEKTGKGRTFPIQKIVNDAKSLAEVIKIQEQNMINKDPKGGDLLIISGLGKSGNLEPVYYRSAQDIGKTARLCDFAGLTLPGFKIYSSAFEALITEQNADRSRLFSEPNLKDRLKQLSECINDPLGEELLESFKSILPSKEDKDYCLDI